MNSIGRAKLTGEVTSTFPEKYPGEKDEEAPSLEEFLL
jgi:hypothetical protein